MSRKLSLLLVFIGALLPAHADANVIITLNLRDAEGVDLSGAVVSGSTVYGELLLAVEGEDDPLQDVRLIQFDFTNTSESLTVQEFEWTFDPGEGRDMYFMSSELPMPQVAYVQSARMPGFILDLTNEPIPVATFEVVVTGEGRLDAVGADLEGADAGAWVRAGFAPTQSFQPALENLTGETVDLAVAEDPTSGEPDPGDSGQDGDDPSDAGDDGGDDDGDDPGDDGGDDPGDDGGDDPGDDGGDDPGDDGGDDPGDDGGDDPALPGDGGDDVTDGDGGDGDPGDGGDAGGEGDGADDDGSGGAAGTCGAAMIGPSLFSLGLLTAVRLRRRLIPRPRG